MLLDGCRFCGASAVNRGRAGFGTRSRPCRRARTRSRVVVAMRRHLIFIVTDLAHVGNFGVVRLPQQALKARYFEQSVVPPVQCHHSKPQRFVCDRPTQLTERLTHQLECPCQGE